MISPTPTSKSTLRMAGDRSPRTANRGGPVHNIWRHVADRGLAVVGLGDRPDDHVHELAAAELGDPPGALHGPVAEDRDPVGEHEQLVEAVADVDGGDPAASADREPW